MQAPLLTQVRQLCDSANRLYEDLAAARWEVGQRESRTSLSLASQLHARVTGLVDALAELNRDDPPAGD